MAVSMDLGHTAPVWAALLRCHHGESGSSAINECLGNFQELS